MYEYIFTDDPKKILMKMIAEKFDTLVPFIVEDGCECSLVFNDDEYEKLSLNVKKLIDKHGLREGHRYRGTIRFYFYSEKSFSMRSNFSDSFDDDGDDFYFLDISHPLMELNRQQLCRLAEQQKQFKFKIKSDTDEETVEDEYRCLFEGDVNV